MVKVSIVTVSFETCELTKRCIESVREECSSHSYEHIIVDNGSTDGTAEMIRQNYQDVSLIALDKNVGFGKACNIGARKGTGELFLFLNSDAKLLDGAISRSLAFARAEAKAGLWGGVSVNEQHELNDSSAWNDLSVWGLFCITFGLNRLFSSTRVFNSHRLGVLAGDRARAVPVISGCFLLIESSLWHELKGFDERFFMYSEDFDLCLRARQLGANPMVSPDVVFIHEGGASEKVPADKRVRLFKAMVQFMEKHWGPFRQFLGRYILVSWAGSRTLVGILLRIIGMRETGNRMEPWRQVLVRRREWIRPGCS